MQPHVSLQPGKGSMGSEGKVARDWEEVWGTLELLLSQLGSRTNRYQGERAQWIRRGAAIINSGKWYFCCRSVELNIQIHRERRHRSFNLSWNNLFVTFVSLVPFCSTTEQSTSWCIQAGLVITISMNLPQKFIIWRILLSPS